MERLLVEAINVDEVDHRVAEVDSDGRFEIGGIDAGLWVVIATVGHSERRADRRVRTTGGDSYVVVEFKRRFRVEGAVLLDGLPFQSTQVLLIEGADWTSVRRTWTGLDGSFSFDDLNRGSYFLGVGAGVREVSVRRDEYVTIALSSGVVQGSVHGAGALQAIVGAEVSIWPSEVTRYEAERFDLLQRTHADSMGQFRFEQVPEGSWIVEAAAWPGFARTVRVDSGLVSFVQLGGPAAPRK